MVYAWRVGTDGVSEGRLCYRAERNEACTGGSAGGDEITNPGTDRAVGEKPGYQSNLETAWDAGLRWAYDRLRQEVIPPKQRYLISTYSSMPYLEPSRPRPDSFTPPKGATSVEMMPVLMPTMPYSRVSATRQTRAMSRP